jgi:hypothetical protein
VAAAPSPADERQSRLEVLRQKLFASPPGDPEDTRRREEIERQRELVRRRFSVRSAEMRGPSDPRPVEVDAAIPEELMRRAIEPEWLHEAAVARAVLVREVGYRRGTVECRLRPGQAIPAEVSDEQLTQWIAEGAARKEEIRTVRFLKDGDVILGSRIYSDVYGRLAIVRKAEADRLCGGTCVAEGWESRVPDTWTSSYGPSAELVPSREYYARHCEAWRGDPNTLHPCPPPRCNPQDIGFAAPRWQKASTQRYVAFQHSHQRPAAGAVPGSVQWVEEGRACELAMDARGRFLDVGALSGAAVTLLATAREVPARGSFYVVVGNEFRFQSPPELPSERMAADPVSAP